MKLIIRTNSAVALAILQACGGGGGDGAGGVPSATANGDDLEGVFTKVGIAIDSTEVPAEVLSSSAPLLEALDSNVIVEKGGTASIEVDVSSSAELNGLFAKILGSRSALFFPIEALSSGTNQKIKSSFSLEFSVADDFSAEDICFNLSARDERALVSPDSVVCLNVQQPIQVNRTPILAPVSSQQVSPGQSVSLSAVASDRDGEALTFQWGQLQGPMVTIEGASSATAGFIAPDVPGSATLIFQVTATDPVGAFSSASAAIAVTVPNSEPMVEAGANQIVDSNATVRLLGAATDADGDLLTFEWRVIGGDAVTLTDAFSLDPSFQAPQVETDSFISLEFEATDSAGASSKDQVVVVVVPLPTPSTAPTPSPTVTPIPTPSPTPISTPSPTPISTPSPTYGGGMTPSPSATPSPTYGGGMTPSPTATPSPTYGGGMTPQPTAAPVPTATPAATPMPPVPTATPYGGKLLGDNKRDSFSSKGGKLYGGFGPDSTSPNGGKLISNYDEGNIDAFVRVKSNKLI